MDEDVKGGLKSIIAEAKSIVEDEPEPFRSIAFEVLLNKLLQDGGQRSYTSPERVVSAAVPATLGEFLASKNIASHVDRVVCIAYYALKADLGPLTRIDIMNSYGAVRTAKPKNLSDVVAQAIRRGLLMDAPEPKDNQKAWQITTAGERYVESKLLVRQANDS